MSYFRFPRPKSFAIAVLGRLGSLDTVEFAISREKRKQMG